ncbi:hypothetical protein THIOSC15_3030003 [uncultured Thiomicrorhabdus sp.]
MKINKNYGFSLLELSIILVIVGVVGVERDLLEQRTQTLWKEADERLGLVKSSLLKFTQTNKYLLCPDTNNDGFEDRTSGACTDDHGSLPFNDLQLSESDVSDSWE